MECVIHSTREGSVTRLDETMQRTRFASTVLSRYSQLVAGASCANCSQSTQSAGGRCKLRQLFSVDTGSMVAGASCANCSQSAQSAGRQCKLRQLFSVDTVSWWPVQAAPAVLKFMSRVTSRAMWHDSYNLLYWCSY